MKKIQNKKKIIITTLVVMQILILTNFVVANSYLISKTDSSQDKFNKVKKNKIENFLNFGKNLLISALLIKEIGIVSAEENQLENAYPTCCLTTEEKGVCVNGLSTDESPMCEEPLPLACSEISECSIGCCYDPEEGICTNSVAKGECEKLGGEWSSDPKCTYSKCNQRGCILGKNCFFETQKQCENREGEFKETMTYLECTAYSRTSIEGGCVYEEGCERLTEKQCVKRGGDFFMGYLCSNSELESFCTKQDHIGCYDGRDEIYWFDSCGNLENIYEGGSEEEKIKSYNGGKISNKENACGNNLGNIESETCGNCNRPFSACSISEPGEGVADGDFICKDLSCKDAPMRGEATRDRLNGESWCMYEGEIDNGKDVVGSEHWLYSCNEGVVSSLHKGNRRSYVCMESTTTDNGISFTQANLVTNGGRECLLLNDKYDTTKEDEREELEEKCNANPFCMMKNVDIDDNFKFGICTSRFPEGAELKDPEGNDENFCKDLGSQTCTVYYYKNIIGNWEAEENARCEKSEFSEKMQDYCISLGDCGSYINYIGTGSDNVKVLTRNHAKNPGELSWETYLQYLSVDSNKFFDSKETEEYYGNLLGEQIGGADWNDMIDKDKWKAAQTHLDFTIGGAGLALFGLTKLGVASLGPWSAALSGASLGMLLGGFIAEKLGRTGPAAFTMAFSMGVFGFSAGAAIYFGTVTLFSGILMTVPMVIFIYSWAIGWGESEERYVDFKCEPWQAPTGEVDCSKCNEDPLKPCTEYRCNAIGQVCRLLDSSHSEENPPCVSLPQEIMAPIINGTDVSEDYILTPNNFENKRIKLENKNHENGCVQELTKIKINFETDEFAQCKWSFKRSGSYEQMEENYPDNGNAFSIKHVLTLEIPPFELLESYDLEGDVREWYKDAYIYLRCRDGWENSNVEEYMINFCVNTEPDRTAIDFGRISTIPEEGSYLKYNTTEQDFKLYLHKPAECRYDNSSKDYEEMSGTMACETDLLKQTIYGWSCDATLKDLIGGENNFYIKCKAQPWLEEEGSGDERAVNVESYSYNLHVSEEPLKIKSTHPNGVKEKGWEPTIVDLRIETMGGAENGKSRCSYWYGDSLIPFPKTDSTNHLQENWNIYGGNHKILIRCEDKAGNIVDGNITFNIDVDSEPPIVVRAYKQSNKLILITNEDAECFYDFNTCAFSPEDENKITIGTSNEHSIDWIQDKSYYIKCKDDYGHTNSGCAIIVEPSF